MGFVKLCVNVDHIATLRQARGGSEPDVITGAILCEENGADGITVHLREDRRHIQDADVLSLKKIVRGIYNLEMGLSGDIMEIAKKLIPNQVTIVPEKREELTTEGGLDVKRYLGRIKMAVKDFQALGILVSLFIEPEIEAVRYSRESGADLIEIHTGTYTNALDESDRDKEYKRIFDAAEHAVKIGIGVNAGHGLNYKNIIPIVKIPGLREVNIGHSIISKSLFTGLPEAVKSMVAAIRGFQG